MAAILLVDDDEGLRFLVAEYLSSAGHDCTQAGTVAQARLRLSSRRFDMIVSDFNMPRESGLDLLQLVLSEYGGTLFIMMTGDESIEIRRKALKMGAYECIRKPFKLSDLLTFISRVLSQEIRYGHSAVHHIPSPLPQTYKIRATPVPVGRG